MQLFYHTSCCICFAILVLVNNDGPVIVWVIQQCPASEGGTMLTLVYATVAEVDTRKA